MVLLVSRLLFNAEQPLRQRFLYSLLHILEARSQGSQALNIDIVPPFFAVWSWWVGCGTRNWDDVGGSVVFLHTALRAHACTLHDAQMKRCIGTD